MACSGRSGSSGRDMRARGGPDPVVPCEPELPLPEQHDTRGSLLRTHLSSPELLMYDDHMALLRL